VYDYAAGKVDWLAADLPFDGTARLAGRLTRRGVAAVDERTPASEALRLLDAQGFGPVLVLNQAGWSWVPPTGTPWHPPPGTLRQAR
jgi:hypothetical protein